MTRMAENLATCSCTTLTILAQCSGSRHNVAKRFTSLLPSLLLNVQEDIDQAPEETRSEYGRPETREKSPRLLKAAVETKRLTARVCVSELYKEYSGLKQAAGSRRNDEVSGHADRSTTQRRSSLLA